MKCLNLYNNTSNIFIFIEICTHPLVSYLFLTRFKIEKDNKPLLHLLSKSQTLIESQERIIGNAKVEREKIEEGIRCSLLGIANHNRGQFKTAIDYHQRHLEIAKEVGDKAGEGKRLCQSRLRLSWSRKVQNSNRLPSTSSRNF